MKPLIDIFYECNRTICTDSRNVPSGALFFAIQGETFDGHDFVEIAFEKGAGHAVVHDAKFLSPEFLYHEKCILVKDTLEAIQTLAHEYRKTFSIPIIAIGGSNGKTTTKELARAVCETTFKTHATKTSQNNHLGVPLTILSMPDCTEIGIFEIGANHFNEHALLLSILQPTHVLVTNNGKDHLEGFGNEEGVRKANAEIFEYAELEVAHAFVCDTEADLVEDSKMLSRTLYGYSLDLRYVFKSLSGLYAGVVYGMVEIQSTLVGDYNEKNIMAASILGLYFGIPTALIKSAIAEYVPSLMRSEVRKVGEYTWIMDCYNANPSSVMAALVHYEKNYTTDRQVVLGDMFELGEHSEREHRVVVEHVRGVGYEKAIFIGSAFFAQKELFPSALFFENYEAYAECVKNSPEFFSSKTPILLKGSRGMKMERCVECR